MAAAVVAAVCYQQSGRIEIWPKQWKSTCGHFIDNTHLATYAAMQVVVEIGGRGQDGANTFQENAMQTPLKASQFYTM